MCFITLILHYLYERYEEQKDDFDHILINHTLWALVERTTELTQTFRVMLFRVLGIYV